jgi:Protein of unknown function (DUF2905)
MNLQSLGRIVAGTGIALVVIGAALWLAGRLGLRRLPGDVVVRRSSFTFVFPLATSLLLGLAACTQGGQAARTAGARARPAATTTPASPKETLFRAVQQLKQGSFKLTGGPSGTVEHAPFEGTFDVSRQVGTGLAWVSGREPERFIAVGRDVYMSSAAEPSGRWLRFDTARLPHASPLGGVNDPLATAEYLARAVAQAERVGPGRYRGTIDVAGTPATRRWVPGTRSTRGRCTAPTPG